MSNDKRNFLTEPDGQEYGLLDTEDNCWTGTADGPALYSNFALARIAAMVSDIRLGNTPGRTRATVFHGKQLRLKDTLATRFDSTEAIRRLEQGEL